MPARERDPEVLTAFGRAVAVARTRQRITQDQLGERAQPPIERAHVGAIERGERDPGLTLVVRLAQALGMTPAQLMEAMEEERGR